MEKTNKSLITKELQDILKISPRVTTVYFDALGRHYLNAFELPEDIKNNDKKALYGRGLLAGHRIIPGHNPEKVKEALSKGNPETLIVSQISREEALAINVVPVAETALSVEATSKLEQSILAKIAEKYDLVPKQSEAKTEKKSKLQVD